MPDLILEEDRFLVLLRCAHWTLTRRPNDTTFPCPYHQVEEYPARTSDDRPAVLQAWELAEGPAPEPDWHRGCTGCWRTIWHVS